MFWLVLLVALLVIYIAAVLAISWISLHPVRVPLFSSPGAMGAPQQDVIIDSEGIPLKCWWVPASGAKAVMILPHGYLMNRAELSPVAYHLWRKGVSCLLVDLRAHGRSGGKKCGLGVYEARDVAACAGWVREHAPGAKLGLLGSSMGSAASALAVADELLEADVLVLDSCYGSMASAVLGWWRFVGGRLLAALLAPSVLVAAPMAGFNPFKINIADKLTRVQTPTLIIHGTKDDLALPSEAQRNYDACAGPKKLVWLEGYGHSEGRWEAPQRYYEELFSFLEEHGFVEAQKGPVIPPTEKPEL